MKEYKYYIFDLYGTLVDIHTEEHRASFWKKVNDLFGSYGILYDYRELRDSYFMKVERLEKEKAEEGHHVEIDLYEVFEMLAEDKGIEADEKMIVELMEGLRGLSLTHLRLYKGAKELLEALREEGKRIYLLSNAQRVFTEKELKDLGIYDLFDDIFISSVVGYKKPDERFFRALLEKHDLNIEDCLMIGNDPICDIRGASALGIDTCYIESGLSPKGVRRERSMYYMKGMDLGKLRREIAVRGR